METHLPTPMTARVELLIYQRVNPWISGKWPIYRWFSQLETSIYKGKLNICGWSPGGFPPSQVSALLVPICEWAADNKVTIPGQKREDGVMEMFLAVLTRGTSVMLSYVELLTVCWIERSHFKHLTESILGPIWLMALTLQKLLADMVKDGVVAHSSIRIRFLWP